MSLSIVLYQFYFPPRASLILLRPPPFLCIWLEMAEKKYLTSVCDGELWLRQILVEHRLQLCVCGYNTVDLQIVVVFNATKEPFGLEKLGFCLD